MYPVDMLKVRLQSARGEFHPNAFQTRLQVLKPAEGGLYSGLTNAFLKIRRLEGSGRMWRGISSVILGAGISADATAKDFELIVIRTGACSVLSYI